MMSRCLVFIGCIIAAQAATLGKRDIPVEVVYDKFRPIPYGIRNLDEKVQLAQEDLVKLKLSDEIVSEPAEEIRRPVGNPYGVKNLEEKVQLSPEELSQAVKHLPNTIDDDDELVASALAEATENQTPEAVTEATALSLLKKAEEIVFHGINSMRSNVDKVTENISGSKPSPEAWEIFNQTLKSFFSDQYRLADLKQTTENTQSNQNQNLQIIQNVISGVQNISSDFINRITQQNRPSEDEQAPGGSEQGGSGGSGGSGQGPDWWQNMMNGFNQIFINISNLGGQNNTGPNGQEDTGTGGSGSNTGFFGFFSQILQGGPQPSGSSTDKPVQGDEGVETTSTTQSNPFQAFQNFGTQIANFGNQIFGGQQNQNKPPKPEDEGSSSTTKPPSFVDNISNAFQGLFSNQGASGGSGSNPISSITNQFQQVIGGQPGVTGGSGATTEKNKDEDTPQKTGGEGQDGVSQKKDPEGQKESEGEKKPEEVKDSEEKEAVTEGKKEVEEGVTEGKKEVEEGVTAGKKEVEEQKEAEVNKVAEEAKVPEEKRESGEKVDSEVKIESEKKSEAVETVDKMT